MTDTELIEYIEENYPSDSFSGNDIVKEVNGNNTIHMQLTRLVTKGYLSNFARNQCKYYFINKKYGEKI